MPKKETASRDQDRGAVWRFAVTVLIVGSIALWLKANLGPPTAPKGDPNTGHINDGPVLGCKEVGDLKRVVGYFAQGDKAAGNNALAEVINSRRCVELQDGEKVFIEHQGFSDEIYVRRPGETVAYWTISRHVK